MLDILKKYKHILYYISIIMLLTIVFVFIRRIGLNEEDKEPIEIMTNNELINQNNLNRMTAILEVEAEENKDIITMINSMKNIENLTSGKVNAQIKYLTIDNNTTDNKKEKDDKKEIKYKNILTLGFLSNFSKLQNNFNNFNGFLNIEVEDLNMNLELPTYINNLNSDDIEIYIEVPATYKKAFDMNDTQKYLYLNRNTNNYIKENLSKDENNTLIEEISDEKLKDIINNISYNKINTMSGIYEFTFNNKQLVSLYKYINKDKHSMLKNLINLLLKNKNNIDTITQFKGQIAVSQNIATDIYIESITNETNISAIRIILEDINDKNISVSSFVSQDKKKVEDFLRPLLEVDKTKKEVKKENNTDKKKIKLKIDNVYLTGENENKKITKFTSKNFDTTINAFINFSNCPKKTNLIVSWYYEDQTIPIIQNTLNNGKYTEGILKTSISFKDKDSIQKGKYKLQITVEGQDKIFKEVKFNIK